MCRLYAFRSSLRSAVHRSLIAAENALARQSAAHPDGWGLGYYVDDYPHLYRSPAQAMADAQLTTARITRHLVDMGVDPTLWLHALDTPPTALYYLSPAEMASYRLVGRSS